MRTCVSVLAIAVLALTAGCAGRKGAAEGSYPPRITHVVFVKLNEPGQGAALLAEGGQMLSAIPGVRFYAQGPHYDAGRSTVDGDYDAAFLMGFDSAEDYRRYVDHPRHQQFVGAWRPRMKWLRVHDVQTLP